ncbi:MAG: hypothetical protein EOP42_06590 [Sphingobacteriaceae bacterium]|nr:MAG: hypothetical protein EOP42_06590 [Sphingobacteriaceae bacterium]
MQTFEDFFLKKKIDLLQLQNDRPELFAEFSKHYPLMGEKSFDHAKKYWFNQLRRTFPLPEIVKPHPVLAEAISDMAIQGMAAAAAQNQNNTLDKPKFTEDHLAELVEENVSVKEVSLAEEEKTIIESETTVPAAKPIFKPRFNASSIKKTEPTSDLDSTVKNKQKQNENIEIEPAKPAFKPRFNMQNIKKEVVKEVSEETVAENFEAPKNDHPEDITKLIEPAKPAFKPRFNMQNIKKEAVKEVSEEEKSIETENPEPATDESEQEVKPVYKPRFQMKNIPKPPAE